MMRVTSVLLALACAACGSTGPSVSVDHDDHYDFSKAKSYAWKPGVPASNELNERRIVDGVDAALAARGFELIDDGAPDLYVLTEVGRHNELESSGGRVGVSVSKRTSWGSVGVGGSRGNQVREVTVGTLVIAILDAPREELVWRANASDTLSREPEQAAATIQAVIERAFEGFPPGAGKR